MGQEGWISSAERDNGRWLQWRMVWRHDAHAAAQTIRQVQNRHLVPEVLRGPLLVKRKGSRRNDSVALEKVDLPGRGESCVRTEPVTATTMGIPARHQEFHPSWPVAIAEHIAG